MSGIAPGPDAWHRYARNMRANFWEMFRQRERADAEAARLRAENAQMRDAIETQGREHWYPCGYGPLCPWCEIRRLEAEVKRWQEHTKDREAALSRIARQNDDLRAEVERLREWQAAVIEAYRVWRDEHEADAWADPGLIHAIEREP